MQIRLTVVGPRSGQGAGTDAAPEAETGTCTPPGQPTGARDVLVTAPPGTPLAAVAGALATVAASSGIDPGTGSGTAARTGAGAADALLVYAGGRQLDVHRHVLGEPPLLDGAVLHLSAPAEATPPSIAGARALLQVVAGPDAGGVHLLRGGEIRIGRSADADIPLDDPDVSRLHCAVRVSDAGDVTVIDLGSTNGTTVDGSTVTDRPRRLRPGAVLRLGESALRLETGRPGGAYDTAASGTAQSGTAPSGTAQSAAAAFRGPTTSGTGQVAAASPAGSGPAWQPGPSGAPSPEAVPPIPPESPLPPAGGTHRDGLPRPGGPGAGLPRPDAALAPPPPASAPTPAPEPGRGAGTGISGRGRGSGIPGRARGGIGAWARRFAGGRPADADRSARAAQERAGSSALRPGAEQQARCPDPAAVLLTALGPEPGLWERGPEHRDALMVRLGTVQPAAGPMTAVTVSLRDTGSLGLAGPRARLLGLARCVLAQLAVGHAPSALEIVLLAVDDRQDSGTRSGEWAWAGWLPHLRPARGQDCRLLFAFDREQAQARVGELMRQLDDGPLGTAWASSDPPPTPRGPIDRGVGSGPLSVVVVDGDPGSAHLRDSVARLAAYGPTAGIHLLCLAEAPAATPASPLASTLEAAAAASPGFSACGTVALLSGAVATGVRVLRNEGAAARRTVPASRAPIDAQGPVTASRPGADAAAGAPHRRPPGTQGFGPGPAAGASSGPAPALRPPVAHPPQRWSTGPATASDSDTPAQHPEHSPGAAAPATVATAALAAAGSTVATVDAVSTAWAERLARALAPLREADVTGSPAPAPRLAAPLPTACRLLDELGLARATPAALQARWAATETDGARATAHGPNGAASGTTGSGRAGRVSGPARVSAILGAGTRGAVVADLAAERAHLLLTGGPGSGKSELLRSLAAALAAEERPDRLGLVLVDADGEGLRMCGELPHVSTYLTAGDPFQMRAFAQALSGELKRRAEMFGRWTYEEYEAYARSGRPQAQRSGGPQSAVPSPRGSAGSAAARTDSGVGLDRERERDRERVPEPPRQRDGEPHQNREPHHDREPYSDREPHPDREQGQDRGWGWGWTPNQISDRDHSDRDQGTLKLRTRQGAADTVPVAGAPGRRAPGRGAPLPVLPRLAVLVDDFDTLVAPPLGHPGRPAAGSVVRALEAVAREGARLGVHLIAASGRPERTAETAVDQRACLRVTLGEEPPAESPVPGRGVLHRSDGTATPFQAGRVTGRIPRTSTLRPTVVPLDWARAGDPPTRRPVRELGNGPTDLALLASAAVRAAQSVGALPVARLL